MNKRKQESHQLKIDKKGEEKQVIVEENAA